MNTATELAKDARIQELEGLLKPGHEQYIMPFGLTQQQAKLLAVLMEVQVADNHLLQSRAKMGTEAKVAVHRLRARMKTYGVTISGKRYRGFWLDDEQKALVRSLM